MTAQAPLPWQDDVLIAQVRLIAQSAAEVTGFGLAEIVLADDDGRCHVTARGGEAAEEDVEPTERYRLTGDDGRLIGGLGFALPRTGARPVEERQAEVDRYAGQVGDAILLALDRFRAAEEVRHAQAVRDLVRGAMSQLAAGDHLDSAIDVVADGIMAHFGAAALWLMFAGEAEAQLSDVRRGRLPADAPSSAEDPVGRRLWEEHTVGLVSRDLVLNLDDVEEARLAAARRFLQDAGYESTVSAPLGSAERWLGKMRVWRPAGAPSWSELELETLLEIGRELGHVFDAAIADRHDHAMVADLRALEAYKSEMVATVSHELKNPLTTLLTNLEMLDGPDATAAERQRILAAIARSTQRMTRIVDDLQLLGARHDAAPVPVDLVPLVRGACETAEDATALRGQHLVVRVPTDPVIVLGDAIDLDRVTMNLLSNAIKYSPTDATIRVTLDQVADDAVLTVADEGIGISEADQQRIFTEFFRSTDPHALAEPGTGLGLAIVHRITERHHGSVAVESQPGEGSTFRVRIPLRGSDDD